MGTTTVSEEIRFPMIRRADVEYLRSLSPADKSVSNIISGLIHPNVRMSRVQAELLRDYLSDLLIMIGFDEEYSLTSDGEIIECLIDKLFVP